MGEVSFDVVGVTYNPPSGAACRAAWADLRAVEVATIDVGPFAEDVFWVLHGAGQSLMVRSRPAGRTHSWPAYRSCRAVIAAMSSAGNERFPCRARA